MEMVVTCMARSKCMLLLLKALTSCADYIIICHESVAYIVRVPSTADSELLGHMYWTFVCLLKILEL